MRASLVLGERGVEQGTKPEMDPLRLPQARSQLRDFGPVTLPRLLERCNGKPLVRNIWQESWVIQEFDTNEPPDHQWGKVAGSGPFLKFWLGCQIRLAGGCFQKLLCQAENYCYSGAFSRLLGPSPSDSPDLCGAGIFLPFQAP